MSTLAEQNCVPCREGAAPLKGRELEQLASNLASGWQVVDQHHLERDFKFNDFRTALSFTNQVGALAESQGHHPDIYLGWGRVRLSIWTHKVGGLTESDFILAAKIDKLQDS